jgi:hypothetical protein
MTKYRQPVHSATNDTQVIRGPPKYSIPLSNIVGVTVHSTIADTASGLLYRFQRPNIAMVLLLDPNNLPYNVLNIFIRRVDKIE